MRRLWPEVLEEVKGKRRFTWILLSQNAQVADVRDGTLTLAMANAGARDSFGRGGSEDILREALIVVLGVDFRIVTMVDVSAAPTASVPRTGMAWSDVRCAARLPPLVSKPGSTSVRLVPPQALATATAEWSRSMIATPRRTVRTQIWTTRRSPRLICWPAISARRSSLRRNTVRRLFAHSS